jgi:hypothetical protein
MLNMAMWHGNNALVPDPNKARVGRPATEHACPRS